MISDYVCAAFKPGLSGRGSNEPISTLGGSLLHPRGVNKQYKKNNKNIQIVPTVSATKLYEN